MPFSPIPVPKFPNVPQLPGVPQLVRSVAFPPDPLPALSSTTQSQVFASSQQLPVWGIFDPTTNKPVLVPDSVLTFDDRNEWKISDFPVQNGQFATYNKVIVPPEESVRFAKTSTLADRQKFLQQLASIAGNTNLYNIVTPEVTYLARNITRYEVMRRDQSGAYSLWEVDVYFRQVIQVAAQYSTTQAPGASTANAQNPAAVPPVNQGNTQPASPPLAATTAANTSLSEAPM